MPTTAVDAALDPAQTPALDPRKLTAAQWRTILTPTEYAILRESATERAGSGRYLDDPGPGAFHCAGCGNRLYGAAHKFHSGCGWPSFFQEVEPGALEVHRDVTFGMVRTEMRCARCGGHLGHIFDDAPQTPTGKRHCVNGYAVVHVPEGEATAAAFARHRRAG
ncbi:MAG: peptide-methionine (R)-S-oxide reductase MsrB [Myxococcota bacterium]